MIEPHLTGGYYSERNWLSIGDSSLSAGFPGKNGTANKRFSICLWARFTSIPYYGHRWTLVTKANGDTGDRPYLRQGDIRNTQ